jgi:predicted nucleotidyltransferase
VKIPKKRIAMISEQEKKIIVTCAEKYNASEVLLFGSSVEGGQKARDIDLGVKGVEKSLFFKFYGELVKHLSKPVDLVDLSQRCLFNDLIEETGVKIYG